MDEQEVSNMDNESRKLDAEELKLVNGGEILDDDDDDDDEDDTDYGEEGKLVKVTCNYVCINPACGHKGSGAWGEPTCPKFKQRTWKALND